MALRWALMRSLSRSARTARIEIRSPPLSGLPLGGRGPQGPRGLKSMPRELYRDWRRSRSARTARIEIPIITDSHTNICCRGPQGPRGLKFATSPVHLPFSNRRGPQGPRGLKYLSDLTVYKTVKSRSARTARIEMAKPSSSPVRGRVAVRKDRED